MPVYGIDFPDIDDLAARLSQALETRLYRQSSPMLGTWYLDADLQALLGLIQEGRLDPKTAPSNRFELEANDPEPGYTTPEVARGGDYLLRVAVPPEAEPEIEARLQRAGLSFRRLQG